MKNFYNYTYKQIRRVLIFILGVSVLLFGVALIFLPGPAFIVIPLGLFILSWEFAWAKRLLKKVKLYKDEEEK